MSVRDLVREELQAIEPYRAKSSTAGIRLDANESPFELPSEIKSELSQELSRTKLNRYPDILAKELRSLFAAEAQVDEDQISIGNGSDELLSVLCRTFSRPRKNHPKALICAPTPSFVMYRVSAAGAGLGTLEVPLRPDFSLDEVAMDRAITGGEPNLVFFARPNNPTGTLFARDVVERLIKAHPNVLVVLDEAYWMFAGEEGLDLMRAHENVLVLRTLSKMGMAALRVGYLAGRADLITAVEKVRDPYNVGTLAQRAAALVLGRHKDLIDAGVKEVIAERQRLSERLTQLGAHVFPSSANFIMIRVENATARAEALEQKGILIKCFDRKGTLLEGCLRITIGTKPENDALLAAWGPM